MDLGSFFGGIGHFLGGLFGGGDNGDDQRKRQQQQQQQQSAVNSFQLQPTQPNQTSNAPAGLQAPQTLTPAQQPQLQQPQLGGVNMQEKSQVAGISDDTWNKMTPQVRQQLIASQKSVQQSKDNVWDPGKILGDASNTLDTIGNTVNDFTLKPIVNTGAALGDMGASAIAGLQNRPDLQKAASDQFKQDFSGSVPAGLVDMANFATRVPQTVAAGVDSGLTALSGNDPGMVKASIDQQKGYGALQDFLGKLTGSGQNQAINTAQQDISTGKGTGTDYMTAIGNSLGLAAGIDGGVRSLSSKPTVAGAITSPDATAAAAKPSAAITSPAQEAAAASIKTAPADIAPADSSVTPPATTPAPLQAPTTPTLEPLQAPTAAPADEVGSNVPAYQRRAEAQANEAAQTAATDTYAEKAGAGQTNLDTQTALQHKQAVQAIIDQGNQELSDFVNAHGDLSPQELQAAKDSITSQVADKVQALQDARFGKDEPAPASPVKGEAAPAKAGTIDNPFKNDQEAEAAAAAERAQQAANTAVNGSDKASTRSAGVSPAGDSEFYRPKDSKVNSTDEIPFDEKTTPAGDNPTAAKVDDSAPVENNPDAKGELPLLQRLFSDKVNIFRHTNTKSGNALADSVEAANARHQELVAQHMYNLKDAFKLSDKDFEKAWRVQEGQLDRNAVSPKIQAAADKLKQVMPDIQKAASDAGVVNGDLGDTYMPHVFPKDKAGIRGVGKSSADAKTYGNLEKERTGNGDNYSRSKETLMNYIDKASQRTAQAEHYGVNNEVAKNLIGRIGAEGGDQASAERAFSEIMRPDFSGTTASKVGNGLRAAFGLAKLPLAAVSHLPQLANVAADTGIYNTLKAAAKVALSPATRDRVAQSGVITPQSLGHYASEYTTQPNKLMSTFTAPGLKPVMKFNRSVAETAYEQRAAKLAAKGNDASIQKLQKLNVKGDIGNKLTDDQLFQAGRGGTKKTMFTNTSADTPMGAESQKGRWAWQFRGAYARPQTNFLKNSIVDPALHGELAPLARYATIGTAGAAGATAIKNAIEGKPNDPVSLAKSIGPQMLGLPGEVANSLINYFPKDPIGTTAGIVSPGLGEMVKWLKAGGSAAATHSMTPVERQALKDVPIWGSKLAETYTPTKAQQQAALQTPAPSSGNPVTDFVNGIGKMFNPGPADPLQSEMKRLETANKTLFSKNINEAAKTGSDNYQTAHDLLNNPIYQAADDKAKRGLLEKVLNGTETKTIDPSLPDDQKQLLLNEKLMGAGKLKVFLQDNKNNLDHVKATIANKDASGTLTDADQDINKKGSLAQQLAIANVRASANVTPDVVQAYNDATKAKFDAMDPQSDMYKQLVAYDNALEDAGLPSKLENSKDSYGSLAKGKGGGAGSKGKAPTPFTFATMPAGLAGTGTAVPYAKDDVPLWKAPALLGAPAQAAIPNGRTISVVKGMK